MDKPNPKLYLGGSISGVLFEEVLAQRKRWTELLENIGFEVIDPVADETILLDANGCADFPETKGGIVVTPEETAVMDLEQVEECDLAIFLLHPKVVSKGSVSEQGFCYGRGIPTFVLRDIGSVHDHGFINGLALFATDDTRLLIGALVEWLLDWEEAA